MATVAGNRLARDERRDQLIRMGVELLGSHGYHEMSLSALAAAAGVSKGLLYHYFPTKSDFVIAVLRQSREELERRLAPDPSLPPGARLDAGLDAFLSFVEERAAGYQAIVGARGGEDEAIQAELGEGRRRRVSMLVDVAARQAGVDRAELESPTLETVLVAWLAYSETVVLRWLSERELTRDEVRLLLRHSLLGAYASVARVDGTAAAARLAEAAERAATAA